MDISPDCVVLEAKYEKIYQALYIKVIVSEKFKVLCGTVLFSYVKFKTNISKQWKTMSIFVYFIFYFPYLTYQQQCCIYIYIILNFLLNSISVCTALRDSEWNY